MNIRFTLLSAVILISAAFSFAVNGKDFTLVIDPGHGGKDYGALGVRTNEKSINLGVALKLGNLVKSQMKDVKVVYTRNRDTFLSLQQRADIANKAGGDLFISIHTNSVDKSSKNRTTVRGAATYTLGVHKTDDNLAVAKRENSVIKLEKDYTATYQGFDPNSTESYIIFEISQNKHVEQSVSFASRVQKGFRTIAGRKDNGVRQAGFWVLAKTSMPAVLLELDFICNPTSEEYLMSESGQTELAKAVFDALKTYRRTYYKASYSVDGSKTKTKSDCSDNKKDSENVKVSKKVDRNEADNRVELKKVNSADSSDDVVYKIQFLTSEKKLKEGDARFKGLAPVEYYKEKGLYKYTFGIVGDKKEALSLQRKIKQKFPQAFMVMFKGDKRIK